MDLGPREQIVKDRIWLIRRLIGLKNEFFDKNLHRLVEEENRIINPYSQYYSLRNYLALTCFDILGQPDDWKDFGSWLLAKSKINEREIIFEKYKHLDFEKRMKAVHTEYTAIYGVKNSFYRFVQELISTESRKSLFNSIRVAKKVRDAVKLPNGAIQVGAARRIEVSTGEKMKFLFKARNAFTHQGNVMGGGNEMFYLTLKNLNPSSYLTSDFEKRVKGDMVFKEKRSIEELSYEVYEWPEILIKIIEDYLINDF